jgi:hypothetical protein
MEIIPDGYERFDKMNRIDMIRAFGYQNHVHPVNPV